MKTSSELKGIAKDALGAKWGQAIGAMFLVGLISPVPFCAPAMQVGSCKYNLKLVRKEETSATIVFDGFNVFGKAFWLNIITSFFVLLWSMLFIVPGIIKAFSYSMSQYILADNPHLTAREALQASKDIMNNKKGMLFYIALSFIGWSLVGSFTLGVAYIWIIPYMQATIAAFYDDIKE